MADATELSPGPTAAPSRRATQAGLPRRLAAGLVDAFFGLVLLTFALALAVPDLAAAEDLTRAQEEASLFAFLVVASVWLNYMVITEWRWGRSAGKAALDISVVSVDANPLTWNRALVRNLVRVADLVAVFFTVPGSERQQRLGDRAAKTMVIKGGRADYDPVEAAEASGVISTAPPVAPGYEPGRRGAPWQAWQPTDALIGFTLIFIGLVVIGAVVIGTVDGEPQSTLIALFAQGVVFAGVPIAIATQRSGSRPWRVVGFTRFRAGDLWLVVGAMIAQVVVTVAVSALLFTPNQDTIIEDVNFNETTVAAIAAFVAIVVVAPVAEEALFRGLFFGAMRTRTSFAVAAGVSGVLFGAVHLTTGDFAVAGLLAFFGVLLAWLYEKTGSLGPPIALHGVNNAIAILPLLV